ncbi:RluA family pseudouridine synthase [Novipirellula caenicola]|uniref:Pseudouridine synthase n=1 Tax=Novipirellula caenicola TaxID=1536901 RepID=A0ABP9W4E7_9BACT
MKRFVVDPLPGSIPYENHRSIRVKAKFSGMKFIDFLGEYHPPTPRDAWLGWIEAGEILIDSFPVRAERIVREGDRYTHVMSDVVEPDVNAAITILHEDDSLIAVDKPAPLPVHPSGRFHRNTLSWMLERHYNGEKLRVAHRLDANTTGVAVLCRTAAAAGFVQPQFERREVQKLYLARVSGTIPWDEHRCDLSIAHASDVLKRRLSVGARVTCRSGQEARTDFKVIQRLPDNTTLVQAIPLTGRTNQIRVHCWSLGFPIVGDLLYLQDKKIGEQQTHTMTDPPMCLHAHRLTFCHPDSMTPVTFQSPPPKWWGENAEDAAN